MQQFLDPLCPGSVGPVGPSDELPPGGPPSDPEEWSDQQWIAWLEETDAATGDDHARPVTALGRVAHSAGGSTLGHAMLAMANALYGREQREIVIVAEGAQPDEDAPLTVHLDPEHPERSVVVVRRPRAEHPPGREAGLPPAE